MRVKCAPGVPGVLLYEGGDSEWFINYPSFIIKGICEQSVSKF